MTGEPYCRFHGLCIEPPVILAHCTDTSPLHSITTLYCVLFNCFRVSSVLGRDVKQYGKKFMFDGADDTCWNSDQVGNIS